MTSELLEDCGRALHGEQWQVPLSRDIDVADRTMRRWVAGDSPIPAGVNVDLLRLLIERAAEIDDLIEKLKRA